MAAGIRSAAKGFVLHGRMRFKNLSCYEEGRICMDSKKGSKSCTAAAAVIIIVYSLVSLFHLGFRYAPTTGWMSGEKGKTIILDLGQEREIGNLSWYLGNFEDRWMELSVGSEEPVTWTRLPDLKMGRVWQWGSCSLGVCGRFIRLTTLNQYTEIKELIVKDPQGNVIVPVNQGEYPELFDETFMDPGYGSIESGMIFDESFFARTAYEYLHGVRSYEDTHPPMGKLMISAGIACFGMNPFGWRISGVIAGTLLLIVIWAFAERLFRDSRISVAVTALMAVDFLHFTESRVGHTDSFLVLFMTAMYYFMYRYYEETEKRKRGWRYLALSGFFFGLAASCKWSGLYGGAGLALIWAVILIRRFRRGEIGWKTVWLTCAVSTLFFIVIPAAIYLTSYIPYVAMDETKGFITRVLDNQVSMFQYHSGVSGEHESASSWYQWPLIIRPVMLYSMKFQDQKAEILALMGNPGLWWPGAAAVFACLYRLAGKWEDKKAFLLTACTAPLLPWIFITRYTFLYHYYPCVPFLTLLMGVWAEEKGKWGKRLLFVCTAVSCILFVWFYPVISGIRTDQSYISPWLEWFPTWKFMK